MFVFLSCSQVCLLMDTLGWIERYLFVLCVPYQINTKKVHRNTATWFFSCRTILYNPGIATTNLILEETMSRLVFRLNPSTLSASEAHGLKANMCVKPWLMDTSTGSPAVGSWLMQFSLGRAFVCVPTRLTALMSLAWDAHGNNQEPDASQLEHPFHIVFVCFLNLQTMINYWMLYCVKVWMCSSVCLIQPLTGLSMGNLLLTFETSCAAENGSLPANWFPATSTCLTIALAASLACVWWEEGNHYSRAGAGETCF